MPSTYVDDPRLRRLVHRLRLSLRLFAVAYALVSANALADSLGDSDRVHELLRNKSFSELETLITDAQEENLADVANERELDLLLESFLVPADWVAKSTDEWVSTTASPTAHLARGLHNLAMGWKRRGTAYMSKTGKDQVDGMRYHFSLAVEDFGRVLKEQPDQVHAYCYLMEIMMAFGQDAAFDELYAAAVEVSPHSLIARWYNLTNKLPRWGGSIPQMIEAVKEARSHYEANPKLRVLEGRVEAELGDQLRSARKYSEAVGKYTSAIEAGGDHWFYRLQRGVLLARQQQCEPAIEDLSMSLRLRPNQPSALEERSFCYLAQNNPAAALLDADRAIQLGRDGAGIFGRRGDALARLGRYAEAHAAITTSSSSIRPAITTKA